MQTPGCSGKPACPISCHISVRPAHGSAGDCPARPLSSHGAPRLSHMMIALHCRVLRAVPVREISIEDGSINVEMDPEDQFKAVQRLEQMNMQ